MVRSDRVDDDGGRFNGRIVLKFLPLSGRIMALLNAGESIERTPVWCSDNLIKDMGILYVLISYLRGNSY